MVQLFIGEQPFMEAELFGYFASFLTQIAALVSQLKHSVYGLVSVHQSVYPRPPVAPFMPQIMTACKQVYEDLTRVDTILRGHVRGRRDISISVARTEPLLRTSSHQSLGRLQEQRISYRQPTRQPSISEQLELNGITERQLRQEGRKDRLWEKIEGLRGRVREDFSGFQDSNSDCLSIIRQMRHELLGSPAD